MLCEGGEGGKPQGPGVSLPSAQSGHESEHPKETLWTEVGGVPCPDINSERCRRGLQGLQANVVCLGLGVSLGARPSVLTLGGA